MGVLSLRAQNRALAWVRRPNTESAELSEGIWADIAFPWHAMSHAVRNYLPRANINNKNAYSLISPLDDVGAPGSADVFLELVCESLLHLRVLCGQTLLPGLA